MSRDIELAKLETYLEQKRIGLIKLIEGTFSGIRARLPQPTLPSAPRHELKTWPEYFDGLWDGTKLSEVRNDDRGFAVGDLLVLREWRPRSHMYTGRWVVARVLRIDKLPPMAPSMYVLLSLVFLTRGEGNLLIEEHPRAVAPEVAPDGHSAGPVS